MLFVLTDARPRRHFMSNGSYEDVFLRYFQGGFQRSIAGSTGDGRTNWRLAAIREEGKGQVPFLIEYRRNLARVGILASCD